MGSLLALLIIVGISLLVVQLGANALVLTGLSTSAAKFQAASAFFGVGFTTSEAEMVVQHSVRRRIILHLIVAGNIGLTSALATLVLTFVQKAGGDPAEMARHLAWTAGGIIFMACFLNIGIVRKPMDSVMKFFLERAGVHSAVDYNTVLNVEGGYCVSEVQVEAGHVLCGKALWESRPSDHGVVILGVHHEEGRYTGAPNKDTVIEPGDLAMVYGHTSDIAKFTKMTGELS